ncbi:MAG: 2-isopropylmalate synthase [Magnetococcales bacterium]|nr:2-isopropylmalate synthase [Magnetococcales bacterium]
MLTNASSKYRPAPPIPMAVRHWPDHTLTQAPRWCSTDLRDGNQALVTPMDPGRKARQAPRWCSTDLRDGNQALVTPMDPGRKARMFQMLVRLGFREIEAGFPAASSDEYHFTRHLVATTPEELSIQVLTSAREEHIRRTFAALQGMPRAIVHFYLSTSPLQRRVVFGVDEKTLIQRAVAAASLIRTLAEQQPDTRWTFQFSPESFSATEPEFALAICEAVTAIWEPTPQHPIILNLPASVEVASPNRYADQIEWFGRHFSRREAIILSIHPHNDRGCSVAAAELALLAGAQRVEGALFGNGERTGNLDLVTLAMNLHSQGIETGLDFSRMEEIIECYHSCTGMEISPRHPYAGALVFTAFSGSHQDAIRKGLAALQPGGVWEVPYLPIDPRDVGHDWESIIRVNSQSGKAGAAHLLERTRGITLPPWLEHPFGRVVQHATDQRGRELTGLEIADLFEQSFMQSPERVRMVGYHILQTNPYRVELQLVVDGEDRHVQGQGNGPIDAACQAMSGPWQVQQYEERAMGPGSGARALSFVHLVGDTDCAGWSGVAIHESIVEATLQALMTAINRALAMQQPARQQEILSRWFMQTSCVQSPALPTQWDARDYAANSPNQFQTAMARVAGMGLQSGESILDIGCGDGKITAELARLVYPGKVLGIDISPEMIQFARDRFPVAAHPNLAFATMDACQIQVDTSFDRVFSHAALHWIKDHRPVLAGICSALRPGGLFHLEMGGRGNGAQVLAVLNALATAEPWSAWIGGLDNPYGFHDAENYRIWLTQAGMADHRVVLTPRTWSFSNRANMAAWIRTTWLPYTQRIPHTLRERFIQEVVNGYTSLFPPDQNGSVQILMVRLEAEGKRPLSPPNP